MLPTSGATITVVGEWSMQLQAYDAHYAAHSSTLSLLILVIVSLLAINLPDLSADRVSLSLGGMPCTNVTYLGPVAAPGDATGAMASKLSCVAPAGEGYSTAQHSRATQQHSHA